MHYVTIVGYNEDEKKIAVMDTTQIIYWIDYKDLEYWMNASGHFLKLFISLDDFNGIIFQ